MLLQAVGETLEGRKTSGERFLEDSVQVLSPGAELIAAFDPAGPFTFKLAYQRVPSVTWTRSYKDIKVGTGEGGTSELRMCSGKHVGCSSCHRDTLFHGSHWCIARIRGWWLAIIAR